MSQRDRESAPTVRGVPTPRGDAPARASAEAAPGRFEHVREIARGGMGRVVEVFDRQLGRTVALKQSLDAHPESRLRFEREVAITARLEHPSIVPVYDAGVGDDGEPYYVMRRVSGKPLDQLVDEAGTLDQRLLLLPNMLAVADAIAHAHQRDVIHRDLKPSNVLIGELGETVVIDWGLAKLVGEADVDAPAATARAIGDSGGALKTTMGTVIGTPGFMAPEQVSADATDARSDVYALGASLFHVLAGRPPFEGSEEAVLAHTLAGEVPRLAALVPGVPPELVTIIDTAMARSPDARYANAGGFSDDLRRFLGGQLVASHHYGRRDRFVRWLRRHRAVVAAVAIGAALAIGVAVVSLRRVLDAQERTEAALAGERARADDLVIAEATAYLETDPTRAIALLEGLPAASPRWATLGPIVADARVRGVAVAYPTHGVDSFVERAPGDGPPLVLTSGDDSVRIHDLSRRTTTVVASGLSHSMRAHWLGRLVAITGRSGTVQLFDPNTSARAEIVASAAIRAVDTAPGVLAYVDDHDVAFTQDIAALPLTGSAHVVDRALPARSVMLSRRGGSS